MSELLESLLPAIDQQMGSEDTPFVKTTHERLIQHHDVDADEARRMIALCLADETERMLGEGPVQPFGIDP